MPGSIAKQSVREIYPQVLALPIARRPLFPGFNKAVVVQNPGQPYLGTFLLKDENTDTTSSQISTLSTKSASLLR
jgi:ATP-dependent Lon protease